MKLNYKKNLKFVTLLITSLLIATVSAQLYRYMYIDGSITITSAKMIWILGADAPADASISGSTAIIDLDVEQGTPLNFTEALFLKNANATGSFNYNITITQALSSSDFQRAKMHIYQNWTGLPWVFVHTLDLTNATDFYSGSLAYGKYLRMTFEVNATVTGVTKNFDVQVQYWVP
jgi:hypothetical protein